MTPCSVIETIPTDRLAWPERQEPGLLRSFVQFLFQQVAISEVQNVKLFELVQESLRRSHVVTVTLQLSNNSSLPGNVLFSLSNVAPSLFKMRQYGVSGVHSRQRVSRSCGSGATARSSGECCSQKSSQKTQGYRILSRIMTITNLLAKAAQLRARGEEVLTQAETMRDPVARQSMIEIAQQYFDLAQRRLASAG